MKPVALLSLVMLFTPLLSQASLGGVESSVQQDQVDFHDSKTNFYRHPTYHIHEITHDRLAIREFVTLDGKVFAVAWKGPAHPDLSAILGAHFQDYKTAMEQSRGQRRGRAPVSAHSNGLRIEVGGHIRSIYGRVWIPNLLPGGFDLSEIQ